jgi:hypothetical protein
MGGILAQLGNAVTGGMLNKVFDRVLPDRMSEEEKATLANEIRVELIAQENKITQERSHIIQEEAKSKDPWVSRARPTFLWIMYSVIIFNYMFIPLLGMIASFVAIMFGKTFPANVFIPLELPSNLWDLFMYGYLGYVGFRTADKFGAVKNFIKK